MAMQKKGAIFLKCVVLLLFFGACGQQKAGFTYLSNTKTVAELGQIENKLERLYYMYCGEFSNERQSSASEDIAYSLRQELLTIPIWQERKGEYWLYSAWFKHGQPDRPLTHGIARLTRENRDSFKLTFYQLPKEEDAALAYAGEWQKAKPFDHLRPKDLTHTPNCYNYIVERAENEFEILALEEGCYYYISEQRQYMRYRAKVTIEGIFQYTQFLDGDKKVSFEYPLEKGFELLRLPKDKPTYPQSGAKSKK
jgi:hypothetical protein